MEGNTPINLLEGILWKNDEKLNRPYGKYRFKCISCVKNISLNQPSRDLEQSSFKFHNNSFGN